MKQSRAVIDGKVAAGISVSMGSVLDLAVQVNKKHSRLSSHQMLIKRAFSQRTLAQAITSLWDMLFCNISTLVYSLHPPLR
jgi:hypothetical protein